MRQENAWEWSHFRQTPRFTGAIQTALIATAVGAAMGGLMVFCFGGGAERGAVKPVQAQSASAPNPNAQSGLESNSAKSAEINAHSAVGPAGLSGNSSEADAVKPLQAQSTSAPHPNAQAALESDSAKSAEINVHSVVPPAGLSAARSKVTETRSHAIVTKRAIAEHEPAPPAAVPAKRAGTGVTLQKRVTKTPRMATREPPIRQFGLVTPKYYMSEAADPPYENNRNWRGGRSYQNDDWRDRDPEWDSRSYPYHGGRQDGPNWRDRPLSGLFESQ